MRTTPVKKAILTVVGNDRVGIIAGVSTLLSKHSVNILDLSQTVMEEYFTMVMLTDVSMCDIPFGELREKLNELGKELELSIRIQHEELFKSMHSVHEGEIYD